MPSLTATHAPKGLEGVVATNSSICYIDGDQGILAYRGIDIHELADHSNFEETCYLLWYGKLPTASELKEFRRQLAEERKLDPAIIDLLRTAPKETQPMDVLRTAVSALSFYDPEDKKNDHDANLHKAFRLTSQIAMIVAAYDRVRKGKKRGRARPVALARRQFSAAAEWHQALARPPSALSISPSSCTPITNSTPPPSPPGWWRPRFPICIPP